MYVYNILTDWKQFYKEGNLDEYIIELLDQYQSLGPLPGIFLPFIESFFFRSYLYLYLFLQMLRHMVYYKGLFFFVDWIYSWGYYRFYDYS